MDSHYDNSYVLRPMQRSPPHQRMTSNSSTEPLVPPFLNITNTRQVSPPSLHLGIPSSNFGPPNHPPNPSNSPGPQYPASPYLGGGSSYTSGLSPISHQPTGGGNPFGIASSPSPVYTIGNNYSNGGDIEVEKIRVDAPVLPPDDTKLVRALLPRQMTMITLGGTIGTGLIIGSGSALERGGPWGLLAGFGFMGLVAYSNLMSICELSTYLPHTKGFAGHISRFWHPAVGFAVGWMFLFEAISIMIGHVNSFVLIFNYWDAWADRVPKVVWVLVASSIIISVNFMRVNIYGEIEFWMTSGKVAVLIILIFTGIVLSAGGNPLKAEVNFTFWTKPDGPLRTYFTGRSESASKFLGFWIVLIKAFYAYLGTEILAVCIGEAKDPRKGIPRAAKQVFWILFCLYTFGVLVIGLIVPRYSDQGGLFSNERLRGEVRVVGHCLSQAAFGLNNENRLAPSPFVLAAEMFCIRTLPHIINASLVIFVLSSAASILYISSRMLCGLASEGKAPVFFRTIKRGVPWVAVLGCSVFTLFALVSYASGFRTIYGYITDMATIFGLITWMAIFWTHIRFMKAMNRQNLYQRTWKSPYQPYLAWFGLIATAIVTILKGMEDFLNPEADKLIVSYIGVIIFPFLFFFWRWKSGKRTIPIHEMKLDPAEFYTE